MFLQIFEVTNKLEFLEMTLGAKMFFFWNILLFIEKNGFKKKFKICLS